MQIPRRTGKSGQDWDKKITPLERAREQELRATGETDDRGGRVVLWYCNAGGVAPVKARIQPGIADDLPALLSRLAVEIGWPGVMEPAPPALHAHPDRALAVWARVWQVREHADLRLLLFWDERDMLQGAAEWRTPEGHAREHTSLSAIVTLLYRVAVHPQASASPHGLLLAGNRALEAGDYPAALACYEDAVRDLPRHAEGHRNLALALARLNRWEEAADIMDAAWQLAPRDAAMGQEYLALLTDAGILAAKNGAWKQAAEHFLRVLGHWPDEATALANLGNIRLREQRLPEARAIFRRFLRLHPEHGAAREVRQALQRIERECGGKGEEEKGGRGESHQ